MKKLSRTGIAFVFAYIALALIVWYWPYGCDGGWGIGNFCGLERLRAFFPGLVLWDLPEWLCKKVLVYCSINVNVIDLPMAVIVNLFFYYYLGKLAAYLFRLGRKQKL